MKTFSVALANVAGADLKLAADDVLGLDVDEQDYSVCVLSAWHADGSRDYLIFDRNGLKTGDGHDDTPTPEEVAAGTGETSDELEVSTATARRKRY